MKTIPYPYCLKTALHIGDLLVASRETNVSLDVKPSNIIQTKPNQAVIIMFPKLSKLFIGYLRDIH